MSDKIQEKVGLTLQSAICKILKKKLQTELSGHWKENSDCKD